MFGGGGVPSSKAFPPPIFGGGIEVPSSFPGGINLASKMEEKHAKIEKDFNGSGAFP